MIKILLNDRFVGSFGVVAPGDDELIVKIAVAAVRQGFAVVPMQYNSNEPACALTIRDSKKPHDCYHVMTEDTKVRAAFTRLIKPTKDNENPRVGLAIDLGASNIGVTHDISEWWVGPEISPTMVMPDGRALYVFDLTGYGINDIPDGMLCSGTLLVPPSIYDDIPVVLVGQMNNFSDNEQEQEQTMSSPADLWNSDREAEMNARIEALEATVEKLQNALIVALTAMKEIKGALAEHSD